MKVDFCLVETVACGKTDIGANVIVIVRIAANLWANVK